MIFFASTTANIIIAVILAVILSIAAYFIARSMKGKLEITLVSRGFRGGETVSGTVTFLSKKNLELRRLYVALIGYEIVDHYGSDGKKDTRQREIYRDECTLEEPQTIPGGFQKSYDFAIIAPGGNNAETQIPGASSTVATVVGTAVQVLGSLGGFGHSGNRRHEWKVEARADLPGVDIASSQRIQINFL
jgi:hypothetical protein